MVRGGVRRVKRLIIKIILKITVKQFENQF